MAIMLAISEPSQKLLSEDLMSLRPSTTPEPSIIFYCSIMDVTKGMMPDVYWFGNCSRKQED
jgi:hypothetical protein